MVVNEVSQLLNEDLGVCVDEGTGNMKRIKSNVISEHIYLGLSYRHTDGPSLAFVMKFIIKLPRQPTQHVMVEFWCLVVRSL